MKPSRELANDCADLLDKAAAAALEGRLSMLAVVLVTDDAVRYGVNEHGHYCDVSPERFVLSDLPHEVVQQILEETARGCVPENVVGKLDMRRN